MLKIVLILIGIAVQAYGIYELVEVMPDATLHTATPTHYAMALLAATGSVTWKLGLVWATSGTR